MAERLTLRKEYNREEELSHLRHYIEILKNVDASHEERQSARKWLEKKLLEYTRAQGIYGNGVSWRDSAAEQGGILGELRETILDVFAELRDSPESL